MCEYRPYINTEGRGKSVNTYFENNSSKIFSCIRTRANASPTCVRPKLIPQECFPACIGFVPGGMSPPPHTHWATIWTSHGCMFLVRGLHNAFLPAPVANKIKDSGALHMCRAMFCQILNQKKCPVASDLGLYCARHRRGWQEAQSQSEGLPYGNKLSQQIALL